MKTIKICIGSACHLRGSYEVMSTFKQLVEYHQLQEKVELHTEFSLNNYTHAVSVMRWDGKLLSISSENARQVFKDEVIAYL